MMQTNECSYWDISCSAIAVMPSSPRIWTQEEEAVERLQEYRTALITAAVTGKIDVRKEEVP